MKNNTTIDLNVCKKHLLGKPVAFTAGENYRMVYKGVITDVVEDSKFLGNRGLLLLKSESADFLSVRAFWLVDSIIYCYQPRKSAKGQTGEPMCDEPVIDGAIPLGTMMEKVIIPEIEAMNRPPEPPSVRKLIQEHGTFTGCKELMDRFQKEGLIRMDGKTLHVDFSISDQRGCMCGFATEVEEVESVTRSLKKFFKADEIIYHAPADGSGNLGSGNFVTVNVRSGRKCGIRNLRGAYEGDAWCGTYPVIKGLNMRWEGPAKKQ